MSFQQSRQKMVDNQIRPSDVTNHALLDAFLSVPREEFFPAEERDLAYLDRNVQVAASSDLPRYMLNPAMLAKLVQLSDVQATDVVLLIGAGTGYTAAIFSELASSVVALETDGQLAEAANENLTRLGYANVAILTDEFAAGCEREAPYDVVFCDASVSEIPQAWKDQLAEEGRLVVVIGEGTTARATVAHKRAGLVGANAEFNCSAPVLPGFENRQEFVL